MLGPMGEVLDSRHACREGQFVHSFVVQLNQVPGPLELSLVQL